MGFFDFFRSKPAAKKPEPTSTKAAPRADVQRVQVLRVTRETPSTVSFEITGTWSFAPGQFVLLRPNDALPWRAYSFSSAPNTQPARLTVKAVEGGQVSPYLCASLKAGATLEVKGPYGQFVLPAEFSHAVAFAGGSGVTPFLSMLHALAAGGWRSRFTLYDFNRTADEQILKSELDALVAQSDGRLEVVHVVDDASGATVFPTLESIQSLLEGRPNADCVALCGPLPLMNLARDAASKRWPNARVLEEKFTTQPSGDEAGGEDVEVEVVQSGVASRFRVKRGESVLAAARDAGHDLPSGCEAGACGACRVKVLDGQIDVPPDACLDEYEREDGYALICVGTVKAPCRFKPEA